jgi:hypothetical protein
MMLGVVGVGMVVHSVVVVCIVGIVGIVLNGFVVGVGMRARRGVVEEGEEAGTFGEDSTEFDGVVWI